MRLSNIDRPKLLRFAAALLAVLLALAVLVMVPLLTHRSPVPDRRFTERPPEPTEQPLETPAAQLPLLTDPFVPEHDEQLQALLDEFLESHPGTWDIYVHDLSYGKIAGCSTQNGEPMISASLIKIYIMGAVFQQIQDGKMNYWDYYPTARKMIDVSDNFCANYLINRLGEGDTETGFAYVDDFARSIGCEKTSLNRTMLNEESEEENYTTAEDCALFLQKLYRYELVSPQYSSDMLNILKAQTINDRIPHGLPEDVVCAHKTGDLEGKCSADAGLVFSPGADYILCVIRNNVDDNAEAVQSIVDLSALVYDYFNPVADEANVESSESPSEP